MQSQLNFSYKKMLLLFGAMLVIASILLHFIIFRLYQDNIISMVPSDAILYMHINLNKIPEKYANQIINNLPLEYQNAKSELGIIIAPNKDAPCPIYILDKNASANTIKPKNIVFQDINEKYRIISCNQELIDYVLKTKKTLKQELSPAKISSYFFNSFIQGYISNSFKTQKLAQFLDNLAITTILKSNINSNETYLFTLKNNKNSLHFRLNNIKNKPTKELNNVNTNEIKGLSIEGDNLSNSIQYLFNTITPFSPELKKDVLKFQKSISFKYALSQKFSKQIQTLLNRRGKIIFTQQTNDFYPIFGLSDTESSIINTLLHGNILLILQDDTKTEEQILSLLSTLGNHLGTKKHTKQLADKSFSTEITPSKDKIQTENTKLSELNIKTKRILIPNLKQPFFLAKHNKYIYLSNDASLIADYIKTCSTANQCISSSNMTIMTIPKLSKTTSSIKNIQISNHNDQTDIWLQ